jgi:HK97 family phage portal protein
MLNKAANLFGLSVVNSYQLAGTQPYFKFFGNNVVWGKWDTADYINAGYLSNAGVYSIVNRITSVASMAAETFRVYKIKDENKARKIKAWTGHTASAQSLLTAIMLKDSAYEYDDKHPFNAILTKPNQWQGISEFVQTSVGFKLLTGNRYIFMLAPDIGANTGKPVALYNLPPQNMQIKMGAGLWDVAGYVLNLARPLDIPVESIIHSRYWNPEFDANGSHLYGLSPLKAASRNLQRAAAAELRATAMLENAGAAGLLYSKGEEMTKDQAEALKFKVNNEILGPENASKIALANGDMGYIPFGMSASDMSLIEQEKYSDEKLANIFKVPPGLFQASANATDNNIAAWNRQLVTQAVIPALADLRDDLNKILALYGPGYYVDYDINVFPEMQEDQEKLSTILNNSPYLTMNEKRIARGFDEDLNEPMMGRYLIPSNLVDITTLDPAALDAQMNLIDQQGQGNLNNENNNA